jgi:hypothetical protein
VGNANPVGPRAYHDDGDRCKEVAVVSRALQYSRPLRVADIVNTYGQHMHLVDGRPAWSLEPPALLGKPLTVDAQGKQATSFRFASDLFDGLMNVAGTPRKRGAGEPRQSWRIRHELARRVGVPAVRPPLRSEPPVAARGQQQAPRAKALPGPRALEWRPWCPAGIGAEANKRLFSQADRQARIGAH